MKWIEDGFWAPVENAFGIKRHSLRKLAGRNGNYYKPEESRDFMKIKPILQQRRKQEELAQKKRRIFRYIKSLSGNKSWMNRNDLSPDDNGTGKLQQCQIIHVFFLVPDQQLFKTV